MCGGGGCCLLCGVTFNGQYSSLLLHKSSKQVQLSKASVVNSLLSKCKSNLGAFTNGMHFSVLYFDFSFAVMPVVPSGANVILD